MRISSSSAQRGNAIVEFALALPIIALFTIGIVDLGRYAYFAIAISNAARAGAAYGSINTSTAGDTTGIEAAAVADTAGVPGSITAAPPQLVCYTWDSTTHTATSISCGAGGGNLITYVKETVSGTMKPLIKYPFVPGTISVSSTAQMRILCPTSLC